MICPIRYYTSSLLKSLNYKLQQQSFPALANESILCRFHSSTHNLKDKTVTYGTSSKGLQSIFLQLGGKKILVPTDRLQDVWRQKIASLESYKSLPPEQKEIRYMQACINYFYRTNEHFPIHVKTKYDAEQVWDYIKKTFQKKNLETVEIYQSGIVKDLDLVSSISASITKYFAEDDFKNNITIRTITEYFWKYTLRDDYLVPFKKTMLDLDAMVKMVVPHINEHTIYHELGSGSGEGLLEVLYQTDKRGRVPEIIIGTEINRYSLESSKILMQEELGGNFDGISLRYANASEPLVNLDLPEGSHHKVIIGANRFFSILEPTSFYSILVNISQQIGTNGFFAAGITTDHVSNINTAKALLIKKDPKRFHFDDLPNGLGKVVYMLNPFKESLEKGIFSSQVALEEDIHHLTGIPLAQIDTSKIVHQVYYNPTKFKEQVESHGLLFEQFKLIDEPMYDKREVFLFRGSESS